MSWDPGNNRSRTVVGGPVLQAPFRLRTSIRGRGYDDCVNETIPWLLSVPNGGLSWVWTSPVLGKRKVLVVAVLVREGWCNGVRIIFHFSTLLTSRTKGKFQNIVYLGCLDDVSNEILKSLSTGMNHNSPSCPYCDS
jgi:hypothetical protein